MTQSNRSQLWKLPFATLFLILFASANIQQSRAGSATWLTSPASGDWNTPTNWMPAQVPDGPSAVATFASSNTTSVSLSNTVLLGGITFNSGASAFTITAEAFIPVTIGGAGVINNSGITQTFVTDVASDRIGGGIFAFAQSANAGTLTTFTNKGATFAGPSGTTMFSGQSSAGNATFVNETSSLLTVSGGLIYFFENSTAGNATFVNNEGIVGGGGYVQFSDHSTAANGNFTNHPFSTVAFYGNATAGSATFTDDGANQPTGASGQVTFSDNSTAASATFTANGASADAIGGIVSFFGQSTADKGSFITNGGTTVSGAEGGLVFFEENSTAGSGYFVNNGAQVSHADGGATIVVGPATAGGGTFIANGGTGRGLAGGSVVFEVNATADNATLIANPGSNGGGGGVIFFSSIPDVGSSRVEAFGNGAFDISATNFSGVKIGSLEGDGLVFLGSFGLTIGTNNRSTTFSGVIHDGGLAGGQGGSLTKIGTGTLTLSGPNTYTASTVVSQGTLLVASKTGSSTGMSDVVVSAGTLGGIGNISGPVAIGTGSGPGAFLSPGKGAATPGKLNLRSSLIFSSDATYIYKLKAASGTADKISVEGVAIASGAQFSFTAIGTGTLPRGAVFTAISNTAATPIAGTFTNLPDGSTFTVGSNTYLVSYEGGDGNDLTLTVQ